MYIKDCYAPFSKKSMDSNPYGPKNPVSQLPIWKWYSEKEMMEGSYLGRTGISYPGSGFNITLPMNYGGTLKELHFLKANNWVDLQTRVVFVDFIVYNANVRLITLIKVAIEFPASSGCRPYLLLRTSQIDRLVQSEMSNTAMLAETILLVLTSVYILHEVQNFRRLGWKYWHDTWVYVEIMNYLLFIAAFIMRFQPFYSVYQYGFPPRPDEFINYERPMWAITQVVHTIISYSHVHVYIHTDVHMYIYICVCV